MQILCFQRLSKESENLQAIKPLANGSRLTEEWLNEAKRVAREKIIIKAHFRDTVFEELGFERQIRPNQKLHYGCHGFKRRPLTQKVKSITIVLFMWYKRKERLMRKKISPKLFKNKKRVWIIGGIGFLVLLVLGFNLLQVVAKMIRLPSPHSK